MSDSSEEKDAPINFSYQARVFQKLREERLKQPMTNKQQAYSWALRIIKKSYFKDLKEIQDHHWEVIADDDGDSEDGDWYAPCSRFIHGHRRRKENKQKHHRKAIATSEEDSESFSSDQQLSHSDTKKAPKLRGSHLSTETKGSAPKKTSLERFPTLDTGKEPLSRTDSQTEPATHRRKILRDDSSSSSPPPRQPTQPPRHPQPATTVPPVISLFDDSEEETELEESADETYTPSEASVKIEEGEEGEPFYLAPNQS